MGSLKGRRVLVTGASGFVGRHLVPALRSAGARPIAASRSDGSDLTRKGSLLALPRADLVVHLAAVAFVPRSWEDPAEMYRVNVGGTVEACEKARRDGARLVLASSYVYGEPRFVPVSEDHPVAPPNPYAHSKFLAEEVVRGWSAHQGLHALLVRAFNLYGPGQEGPFLIPSILRQLPSGRVSLGDPTPRRDFLHVDDVVRFYVAASSWLLAEDAPEPVCLPVNAGAGRSFPVRSVAERMVAAWGSPVEVTWTGTPRRGDVSNVVADIRRARETFGWAPRVPFEDGLRDLVRMTRKKAGAGARGRAGGARGSAGRGRRRRTFGAGVGGRAGAARRARPAGSGRKRVK